MRERKTIGEIRNAEFGMRNSRLNSRVGKVAPLTIFTAADRIMPQILGFRIPNSAFRVFLNPKSEIRHSKVKSARRHNRYTPKIQHFRCGTTKPKRPGGRGSLRGRWQGNKQGGRGWPGCEPDSC